MASIISSGNGTRMIGVVLDKDSRKFIRLGKISIKQAETIKLHVEDLAGCKLSGGTIKNTTAEWLAGLRGDFYLRLVRAGLAAPRERLDVPTVANWIKSYTAGRTDVKPGTKLCYRTATRNAVAFFGANRLDAVTAGDADSFRVYLKEQGLAEATIRRRCKRIKQFFTAAVKHKIILASPFADMRCGNYTTSERFYFVSQAEAQTVLNACPDTQWRVLFALCRYGGLRCPSEPLALRWSDINWGESRFVVHSSKTEAHDGAGVRIVPIFPELQPYLQEAFEAAEPGTEYVITRYRDTTQNLRTQLGRIITKAGLVPWAKPFQNLRSTRETELCEQFPLHVVCAWLGNTATIASKHYLQVTDQHYRLAVEDASESASKCASEHSAQTGKEPHGATAEQPAEAKIANKYGPVRNGSKAGAQCEYASLAPTGFEPVFSA